MNSIVVAIEFDEELDDIIEFTGDLVRDKKTTVHVVHAYQSHSELADYAPYLVGAMEGAINQYEEYLQNQAETVKGIIGKLTSSGIDAHGYMKPISKNIVESILEFSKEKDGEMIVVGSHHPGRVERLILGSVAEKLVQSSDIPVAVVPRKKS